MADWPPRYADWRTLEGKLQRGLGSGFLEALEAPQDVVHGILMRCIEDDPALDIHLDHRDSYYGDLAHLTGLDLDPLREFLVDSESDEEGRSYLTVCVLARTARRGHQRADQVLRDYVGWGPHWHSVLREMDVSATSPNWMALAKQMAERAAGDPHHLPLFGEPYESWATAEPAIAALTDLRPKTYWKSKRRRGLAKLRKLPTEVLLTRPVRGPVTPIIEELGTRHTEQDRAAIAAALVSETAMTRAIALATLADQGDTHLLETMLEMATTEQHPPYASRIADWAALQASVDELLPIARRWRSSPTWKRRHFAFEVFKRHATVEDLPWVRSVLQRTSADKPSERFVLTTMADIISARFAGERFPILGRRFDAFTYSYGRQHLARALAVTDPTFPTTRAFSSLWDCESGTRVIAAEHVSLHVPGAIGRLREMASDPLEDDSRIAEVAKRRLAKG